jgi:hypothetical protein
MKTSTRFALLISSVACSVGLLVAAYTPAQAAQPRTGSTTVEHVAPRITRLSSKVAPVVVSLPEMVVAGSSPKSTATANPSRAARRIRTASAVCLTRTLEQGGSPAHPTVMACEGNMAAL